MYRYCLPVVWGILISFSALGQPGGGGGAELYFKGMRADSARFFLLESDGNPAWVSQSNALPLNKSLMIYPVGNWNDKLGSPCYQLVFYQGDKSMTVDIAQLAQENPVGFTPGFDSLEFIEGNWSWNLNPYWPSQEDVAKGYGVTNRTKSIWEKDGFWKKSDPREKKISPLYLFNQAMAYRRKHEWSKSSEAINKAIDQARNDDENLIFNTERLILLMESEDWKSAYQAACDLLKKYPSNFRLNQHCLNLAIRFKDYSKADSCYQQIIRQEPDYQWDYYMFLSAYMQQGETAYLRGLEKLHQVKYSPWEGEPIGIASNCGSYFMMARLAEKTGHISEASQFAYEAALRGYGYYNSNIDGFEQWHEQHSDYPYFSLAYALYLHHATSYDNGNSLLQEANRVLEQIPPSFSRNADYWWVMGLVNDRLQDWEAVSVSGKKLLKLSPNDMRGHYLLFRFYGASTPKFNQKKSEKHRLKYVELKAEKLDN
jgi:hypothetical protein